MIYLIIDREDVNNPIHPNLFDEWLEILELPENSNAFTLKINGVQKDGSEEFERR